MQWGCCSTCWEQYLFQMLAETNLETFNELGVKKVVASCPHCFHTLGKEYKDYGGEDIEVMHHSQLISHLQNEGKLPQPKHDGSVTYHDPCYLAELVENTMRLVMPLVVLISKPNAVVEVRSVVVLVAHRCGWKNMFLKETIVLTSFVQRSWLLQVQIPWQLVAHSVQRW